MTEFVYSVWFTDLAADPENQDREWVACVGIEAPTAEEAQAWGDTLSRDRAARSPNYRFERSFIELKRDVHGVTNWSTLPNIQVGQVASDFEIGW